MTAADADGVYRTSSEAIPATDEERRQVMNRTAEEVARRKQRYQHFLKQDPDGAWVAVDGDTYTFDVTATTKGTKIACDRRWLFSLDSSGQLWRARTTTNGQLAKNPPALLPAEAPQRVDVENQQCSRQGDRGGF